MKPRRDISPHWFSLDMAVNASLTLAKIHKRIRLVDPAYRPPSRYQSRLKHRRAARLNKPGMVR